MTLNIANFKIIVIICFVKSKIKSINYQIILIFSLEKKSKVVTL